MAIVKPFQAVRPVGELAGRVAALPYDVYNREEAEAEVNQEPLSFLAIDRAETSFGREVAFNDPVVYKKAAQLIRERMADQTFIQEEESCYYIYELVMDGRSQTGLVACSSIDDYLTDVVKKHEKTREDKELDRISHVDICNAQTGPIFLAYRKQDEINHIVANVKNGQPVYDFTAPDGVIHRVWKITGERVQELYELFKKVPFTYIADGHHRAASAVKVGLKRRAENPSYTGEEEFNYFLSVLFPDEELYIMPYNRVVKDLNGLTPGAFVAELQKICQVRFLGETPFSPDKKGSIGMFLEEGWYQLDLKASAETDPVKALDVYRLQTEILEPVLGVGDPRTDKRIDFVGGIRGLSELEKRVSTDMTVAFSMYPTSIEELLSVADAGLLMPPKSTWFEPKLRSGLFLHLLS